MKRKLAFRVWDESRKIMVYPDSLRCSLGEVMEAITEIDYVTRSETSRVKENIMQFTGVWSVEGREVFEGDIINVYDTNLSYDCEEGVCNKDGKEIGDEICEEHMHISSQEVKWNCGYFCDETIGDYCPPLTEDYLAIKVVGNIYENPILK